MNPGILFSAGERGGGGIHGSLGHYFFIVVVGAARPSLVHIGHFFFGWGQWASYPDAVEAVELGGAGPGR